MYRVQAVLLSIPVRSPLGQGTPSATSHNTGHTESYFWHRACPSHGKAPDECVFRKSNPHKPSSHNSARACQDTPCLPGIPPKSAYILKILIHIVLLPAWTPPSHIPASSLPRFLPENASEIQWYSLQNKQQPRRI